MGVGLEGWGPASSSTPRRAHGPREAGRPWGAVPGGGGGGDAAAAAAAAVAAAAVAFAGATAASSGRDAERASESGGEERGAHRSWIPHSNFKPRPRLPPASLAANRRAPWTPSRVPIGRPPWQCGRGAPGENHSWNPVPTPKPRTAPLSSSRPRVHSRRPEPIRRLPRPNPLSYWPLGSRGLPWRKPREIRVFGAGSWDRAARPHRLLCPRPFHWTVAGGRGSALGGPGERGRPATRVWGATWIPGRNLGMPQINRPPWRRARAGLRGEKSGTGCPGRRA